MQIKFKEALSELQKSKQLFNVLAERGSLTVELYQPKVEDLQQPHTRDEVYIIASGSGTYNLNGEQMAFNTGDFLFAPAHIEHRFENFTEDFSTWVIFYGPEGGE